MRLEEVEPTSGAVLKRAEASFNVPAAMIPVSSPALVETTEVHTTPAQPQTEVAAAIPIIPEGGASPSNVIIPKVMTATVIRGDSLWKISRHTYGDGERYPTIFGANRKQIRNPDLIYPGQIFVLPTR